ncbi:MAG TPA: GNAT family N-acetyltransferase [Acidimicrobiales bacterium]|nr:GNAT family N-acetyltransferase [Acidimicrobiales bacterium]
MSVPVRTDSAMGLDYDRRHDSYSNYMTSVMTEQAPSGPSGCLTEVTVLRPAASDAEAVIAMLSRCSRATLFHRFHGFTDGRAYFGALLEDRPLDGTVLAWYRSACVGVATLGVGAIGTFDLGVLVEDAWQRRGVGTQLTSSVLERARARGVGTVHAGVLGEDRFILKALRRIGPLTVSIDSGTFLIDIDISKQGSQPSAMSAPPSPGGHR